MNNQQRINANGLFLAPNGDVLPDGLICTICNRETRMLHTKLCNRCWELQTRFDSLAQENLQALEVWLQSKGYKKEGE
jgi:hypothetical protein